MAARKNFELGERVFLRFDQTIDDRIFGRGSSGKVLQVDEYDWGQAVLINFGSGIHVKLPGWRVLRNPPKEWST